jgi:translation initiation factor IF-1
VSGDALEVQGEVLREERGDVYRVTVATLGREVLAKRSGRLVKNHIRILPGDVVTVEVSPYDVSRGRITYRGVRRSD